MLLLVWVKKPSRLLCTPPTNTVGIEAQRLTLKAVQDGTSATFDTFEDTLADLFIITRDGMKFDTITTGTTSANTIHIRDISETLPATGGKIYVTIVQYGEHGVNGKADGEVLVKRAVLNTTLPSGAVSLKPSEVAAEVGAQIVAGRQARFVFEVETNRGEVAVEEIQRRRRGYPKRHQGCSRRNRRFHPVISIRIKKGRLGALIFYIEIRSLTYSAVSDIAKP